MLLDCAETEHILRKHDLLRVAVVGGHAEMAFCLEHRADGRWDVYWRERGSRVYGDTYDDEDTACRALLKEFNLVAQYLTLEQVEEAARAAHQNQVDKAGRPYVEHLAAVAEGVRARGGSAAQVAAAWLHDSIEDDALSAAWLENAALPQTTKDIVLALTKGDGEDADAYAQRILTTPGARLVKESDLAHNANPERLAVLDEPTEQRLTRKYAHMRQLLGLE